MANEKKPRRRKKLRQEWNPHWSLKLLYMIFSVAGSVLKIAVGAAATVLLIVLICGTVFVGTLGDYLQEDILTEAADWSLDDYDLEQTSFIYYVDNHGDIQLLQQIYTTTDRQWASIDEIPEDLIHAAVAIEDKRFYEHQGVDWITTMKACLNMFFGGDEQFGGSTITQQFIKNHTGEKSVTVQRKVMEIFRAQIFEREYDKDLIMEYYLNEIYLGRGCYGVKSAAAEYFGKELRNLTTAECASLISITNNPSLFNPYSESVYMYKGEERDGAGRNRYRQLNVLSEMLDQGYLTQEEYDAAVAQEMVFKEGIADADRWTICDNCGYENTRSHFTGEGDTCYCPQCGEQVAVSTDASQHIYSWFVDAVIVDFASYLADQDGKVWDDLSTNDQSIYLNRIQKGGYHIYTTLDMDVQKQVDAVYTDLSNIPTTRSEQQLQSAIVVINNETGDVVALSGGVGEKTTFLAYNKATQAKLQTGSSQKPISVYAPAFESGEVTPASVMKDLPMTYIDGNNWPKNDNRQYQYARTVYQGIVSSVNTVSARTLDTIGADYGYSFAKYNFGQSSLTDNYPLPNGQSLSDVGLAPLALGALTVGSTVREMSAAYATFANDGVYREPRLFTKVYDSNGRVVVDNEQESRKILSQKTVDYMNYCLFNAANNGTGGAAIFAGQNIAGKTGTTSSNRDRWFCGYTTHYTAAVWCGYDIPEQIYLTGSSANPAARLWKAVMQPIHDGLPREGLYNGNAFHSVGVCLDSGKKATAACSADVRGLERVVYVNVYDGDEPEGTCDKHIQVDYCVTGGGVATDYCYMFSDAQIESRSLVKLTQAEVDEIKAADGFGLNDIYTANYYVYLIDSDGNPASWHGFYNNLNNGVDAPYIVCPLHNQSSWEEYQPGGTEEDTTGGWDNSSDGGWHGGWDGFVGGDKEKEGGDPMLWISDEWKEYEVLDASGGERLERWGKFILVRPDPQVIWDTPRTVPQWKRYDARYVRSNTGGGHWTDNKLPERWQIHYKDYLTFNVKPMNFKHTGVFPEQAANWDFIREKVAAASARRPVRVLNLFAYSGGATLAAAAGGAEVYHVDASKGMVAWAKENAVASGLADRPIHWIVDDCGKFIQREIRRGRRYDGIIMDPPSYGRGPSGEIWKMETSFYPFLQETVKLLSDDPLFVIINSYTTGLAPSAVAYASDVVFGAAHGGKTAAGELGLPVKQSGLVLPCGATGRWTP